MHGIQNYVSCRPIFQEYKYLTMTRIYITQAAHFVKQHRDYFYENNILDYNKRFRKRYELILTQSKSEAY